MKIFKTHLIILIALVVFGCQTNDFKTETSPEVKTTQVNFFSANDIPQVLEKIQSPLGIERTTGAANQSKSSIGLIRMDEIMQVIDTLGNDNYTFSVDDQDNNHLTFSNLIVPMGVNDHRIPYLMKYEMDSSYFIDYVKHGFSIQTFKGTITRQFLYGGDNNRDGTANLEGKSLSNNDCDGGTGFDGPGGNNDPGGTTSGTEPYYNWDPAPPIFTGGGQCTWQTVYPPCPVERRRGKEYSAKPHTAAECGDHIGTPNGVILLIDCNQLDNLGAANTGNCDNWGGDQIGLIPDLSEPVQFLSSLIPLNNSQISWLQNNPAAAFDLQQMILENGDLDENGFITEATTLTVQSLLDLTRSGLLEGNYTPTYVSKISPYTSKLQDPSLFTAYLSLEVAFLVAEHGNDPEWFTDFPNRVWNKRKLYFEAALNAFQTLLDLGGLAPVVGEVFDVFNGGIYLIRGDGVNAAFSFSSAVPIAGWFSTGAKFATKGSLRWVLKADNYIDFGRSSKLRKILGLADGDKTVQAHHILVWAERQHPLIQKAASSSTNPFHMNDALNGIPVASWRNQYNHPLYNNRIKDALDRINDQFPNLTPDEAVNKLQPLIQRIRQAILDNPNTHLNDIVF